jgi:hypothetical protein
MGNVGYVVSADLLQGRSPLRAEASVRYGSDGPDSYSPNLADALSNVVSHTENAVGSCAIGSSWP